MGGSTPHHEGGSKTTEENEINIPLALGAFRDKKKTTETLTELLILRWESPLHCGGGSKGDNTLSDGMTGGFRD